MEEKETQTMQVLEIKASLEDRIANIFIGFGLGITAILIFCVIWIPLVAALTAEYNWLLK